MKYMTKKRKSLIRQRKFFALLFAIMLGSSVIGFSGVSAEKEMQSLWHTPTIEKEPHLPISKDIDVESLPVVQQIRVYAQQKGFKDVDLLLRIAKCESSFRPDAINVNTNRTYDLGLFQFNSIHKNGSKPLSVEWSTNTAIDWINDGRLHAWNSSKHCWK